MKHILFIAPHSYPIKSSESICNSKVIYALAKAGHRVDVFTREESSTYPIDRKIDTILRNSENIKIITIKSEHGLSYKLYGWYKFIKNIFYNLSILIKTGYFSRSISVSYDIAKRIDQEIESYNHNPYDMMITRGFYTDYAGLYIAKKYGIKWIANWNDPYPVSRFPKPYGTGPETKLSYFEHKLYMDMQRYITIYTYPNPRLRDYMLQCFTLSTLEQTIVIPHMAHSEIQMKVQRQNSKFRIVHCGDAKPPRDPRLFLTALSKISHKHNLKIDCVFLGHYSAEVESMVRADEYLLKTVRFLPPQSYSESIAFMCSCHMTLIIEAICEEGIYLPTKVVDSIQCGLPIFCVSPRVGVMNDLTTGYKIGYCADNTSVKDIESKLLSVIHDFQHSSLPIVDKTTIPDVFEDAIVRRYNTIFN